MLQLFSYVRFIQVDKNHDFFNQKRDWFFDLNRIFLIYIDF